MTDFTYENPGGQVIARLGDQLITALILDKAVIRIGRTPDNDLALPSFEVARRHAEIRLGKHGPSLIDLGSSTGTKVGGTPVLANRPRLLLDGETFQIGPYSITYRSFGAHAEAAPAMAIEQPTAVEELHPGRSVRRPSSPPVATRPSAAPQPDKAISSYLRNLPEIFQDDDFLNRLLLLLEEIWEPFEQRQDHIEMYFDPHTCPVSMLPWLAGWLDTRIEPGWPEALVRDLVSESMELHDWRGTIYGLTRTLEVTTGISPQIIQSPEAFVFTIKFPKVNDFGIERAEIRRFIDQNKPAHAGYVLEFD